MAAPKVHSAALRMPAMSEEEFTALCVDIQENGLLVPIELYDGKIIDGRHRQQACDKLGIKPEYVETDLDGLSPEAYVKSLNVMRRHLTPSQRAAHAVDDGGPLEAERAAAKERQARKPADSVRQKFAEQKQDDGKAAERVAKVVGTNREYVRQAEKIKQAAPEVFEQIKSGEKTVQQAVKEVFKPAPKPKPQYGLSDRFLGVLESFVIAIEEVYQTFGGPKAFHKHPEFDPKMLQFVEQHMQSLCQLIEQYRKDS